MEPLLDAVVDRVAALSERGYNCATCPAPTDPPWSPSSPPSHWRGLIFRCAMAVAQTKAWLNPESFVYFRLIETLCPPPSVGGGRRSA